MTEIASETGTSLPTVQREVARLEEAGLVATCRRGNTRLVRPLTDTVIYRPLAELLAARSVQSPYYETHWPTSPASTKPSSTAPGPPVTRNTPAPCPRTLTS